MFVTARLSSPSNSLLMAPPTVVAKEPFHFVTHLNLTELTGKRVRDLYELLEHLRTVPESVIYYHTHHFLEQHQFLSPEPPNDFAYWVTYVLQEERLGERLAAIDTIEFETLGSLRDALIKTIQSHLQSMPSKRVAPEGQELHLMSVRSFILPTPFIVRTLQEFATALRRVSIYSLYHHVFEARLRLHRGNDFTVWFENSLGEKKLADQISQWDPYTQTLEGLRARMHKLIRQRLEELHYASA